MRLKSEPIDEQKRYMVEKTVDNPKQAILEAVEEDEVVVEVLGAAPQVELVAAGDDQKDQPIEGDAADQDSLIGMQVTHTLGVQAILGKIVSPAQLKQIARPCCLAKPVRLLNLVRPACSVNILLRMFQNHRLNVL